MNVPVAGHERSLSLVLLCVILTTNSCLIIQSCDKAAEFLKLEHQSSYFSV